MREIKFRAYSTKYGMTESVDISELDGSGYFGTTYLGDDAVIMQYTGIKDKNGVEIYEGDIVTVSFATQWAKHKSLKVVTFDTGAFTANGCYGLGRKGLEVVGNIHETPELLNES